ncbi:MAG: putative phosphoribosyltransferase [Verrucomicrobiales bacterium]|nr:putative phosphoribosyltransferase [Verrucomicrobiales bacterium]
MKSSIQSQATSFGADDTVRYQNRRDAGKALARHLSAYQDAPDAIVLALPRGGVPVAYEVAERLHLPLDLFMVRKLGVPLFEELAMGAIASGGVRILNEEVINRLRITPQIIDAATEEQQDELRRREFRYRGDRPPLDLDGKRVILIDDGLATGSSMRAAIQALRLLNPEEITVAVPVGCLEICEQLQKEVGEVICAKTPEPFQAVGQWYADFGQTNDAEVTELFNRSAHHRRVREIAKAKGEPIESLTSAVV